MNLSIFTLAFNAMPFIERHLPTFEKLAMPWNWWIVHGAAMNGGSTAWCAKQKPGLSTDGTTEYLRSIKNHDHVSLLEKKSWPSKDQMCNASLEKITEPCVLLQCDSDELWSVSQIQTIVRLFDERPDLGSIMFACRYFVGPNLVLQGERCYSDFDYEWQRSWRYKPGLTFSRHEPPLLDNVVGARMPKQESRKLIGTFDHFPYVTEEQCAFKERFYNYPGLVNQWRALQAYDKFPVSLSKFFKHVQGDFPKVVRV